LYPLATIIAQLDMRRKKVVKTHIEFARNNAIVTFSVSKYYGKSQENCNIPAKS